MSSALSTDCDRAFCAVYNTNNEKQNSVNGGSPENWYFNKMFFIILSSPNA